MLALASKAQTLAANTSDFAASGIAVHGVTFHQQQRQNLEQVLGNASEHYGVFFNYYPEAIRRYQVVVPDLQRLGLEEALVVMLKDTDLSYRRTGESQVVVAPEAEIQALPAYRPVNRQQRSTPPLRYSEGATEVQTSAFGFRPYGRGTVSLLAPFVALSGRVQDEDGIPMIGVSVLVDGTGTGTVTDVDGNYSLNLPELAGTIVFSYLGYETQRVDIAGRSIINIDLAPSQALLDEVVVIGYGTRDARDLTGAVSAVGAAEIEKSPNISPEAAIQGRLPGVYISTPGGNPGARPEVQIRGIGTFGNAQPLYVIDGVPITEFGTGAASNSPCGDLRGTINILSFINPADIESVSVLKDASAAAIYGVRAANGVILITTKKGRKGAPRVSLDASYGFQEPVNTYDVLNVDQYVDLYTDAFDNDPNEELPDVFDPNSPRFLGNRPTTDWQEELINSGSTVQNYGLRISGGNESTTYYLVRRLFLSGQSR